MIISFADRETQKIFHQEMSAKLPASIQSVALRKLILIDQAEGLADLRVPPGNHLEALAGDRAGQFSIRINDKYRICSKPVQGGFAEVEIVDYH